MRVVKSQMDTIKTVKNDTGLAGGLTRTASSNADTVMPLGMLPTEKSLMGRLGLGVQDLSRIKLKDFNKIARTYYEQEPIVGSAIDLHASFPVSRFEVTHPDSGVQKFCNEMVEKLNLYSLLLDIGLEYNIIGEVFPFGIVDDKDKFKVWKGFVLLPPDSIDLVYTQWGLV